MKKTNTARTICYIICALLMVALAAYQFMPFWTVGEDSTSLQGYTWFPDNHKAISKFFRSEINPDYKVNDVILLPIVSLVVGALGAILCLIYPKKLWIIVFPILDSVMGIVSYLTNPYIQMGEGWQIGLALSIAIGVAIIIPTIQCLHAIYKWLVPDKLQVEAR